MVGVANLKDARKSYGHRATEPINPAFLFDARLRAIPSPKKLPWMDVESQSFEDWLSSLACPRGGEPGCPRALVSQLTTIATNTSRPSEVRDPLVILEGRDFEPCWLGGPNGNLEAADNTEDKVITPLAQD